MKTLVSTLVVALALFGCDESSAPGAAGGSDSGDGGAAECDPGALETCYEDPRLDGETMYCSRGTRTCGADGSWGPCVVNEEFTMPAPPLPSELITGPTVCNACDPACNLTQTYPDDTDLTMDNSDLTEYDPTSGGVVPTLVDPPDAPPDDDGDGVPNEWDPYPTDPTLDGYTENGEIFHVLYYGGASETSTVGDAADDGGVLTGVRRADVYFLMDGTISMGGEMSNLSAALTNGEYLYDPTTCGLPGFTPPVWDGEYYDNRYLTDPPKFTTTGETGIDYDWGHHAPVDPSDGEVITTSNSYFSVRWTTTVDVGATSVDYLFRMSTNDGMRVYVDGVLVADEWRNQEANFEHSYTFSPGAHTVVVEYYEYSGDARAKFFMSAVAPDEYKGLVGSIRCSIGDAYFGLGYFDDVPISPYGQDPTTGCGTYTDSPYVHILDMMPGLTTGDLSTIQAAADTLQARCGLDYPESAAPALHSLLTGGALGPAGSEYTPARDTSTCALTGSFGYPCFRNGTVPIIVLFTDAETHQGPWPERNYGGSVTDIPAYSAVLSALANRGAKVVGIHSGYPIDWDCSGDSCISQTCTTEDHPYSYTHTNHCASYTCVPGETYCHEHSGCNLYDQVGNCIEPYTYTNCHTPSDCTCDSYYDETHTGTTTHTHCTCTGGYTPKICWEDDDTQESISNDYGLTHLRAIATASGATDPDTGAPLVYQINRDGTGIGAAVAGAIGALSESSTMDITVQANDNPSTTSVDETQFLVAVATNPDSSDPATDPVTNCVDVKASWYQGCLPGTNVRFDLTFENTIVAPTAVNQVFTFTVDVLGEGIYVLGSIPVTIVVPAGVPGYPDGGGTVWQDYDTTGSCTGELRPDWQDLSWTIIDQPPDTTVVFELQTADDLADLSSAPIVSVTVPSATSPVDVANTLIAGGQPNNLNYLRVTARLLPSPDLLSAPTLDGFDLTYECVPVL